MTGIGPIYTNKALFGSWVSLLMEADAAYPAPAPLPRWLADDVLDELERHGVVQRVLPDHYTLSGLAKERIAQGMGRRAGGLARAATAERDDHGRLLPSKPSNDIAGDAGDLLDQQGAHVAGDQHHLLTRPDQTKRDETRPDQPAGDPADDYWQMTGKYPSDRVLEWIDSLTGEYGAVAVTRTLARCHQQDGSTKTLLGRVQDELRRDARKLDRREKAAELARIEANRPPKGVNIPILIARHNNGAHADDPDANCPSCRRAAA